MQVKLLFHINVTQSELLKRNLYPVGLYPVGLYPVGLYPVGLYPVGLLLWEEYN